MWGLVHSHDCPHQYIHMHPCTLKREKLGIFRPPSSCLCVLSLSDGAQCLFLCLPLGSVLFLYPAAGSLISHQRGYTGGSVCARQIAIGCAEAASPLSSSLCALTATGRKEPAGAHWEIFCVLFRLQTKSHNIETKT